MTKIYCDRCGDDTLRAISDRVRVVMNEGQFETDLCKNCRVELKQFLAPLERVKK